MRVGIGERDAESEQVVDRAEEAGVPGDAAQGVEAVAVVDDTGDLPSRQGSADER